MTLKTKLRLKIVIDILMTISIILLMSYELLGSLNHEIVGIIMFILFISHHLLNINWARYLNKGRQTVIRIFQNIIIVLLFISFIGSIVSGIMISRHLFTFLNIKSTYLANRIHMLSAYVGFILMSLHLGIHFNTIWLMMKSRKHFSNKTKNIFKILFILIFIYGIYAFYKRDILNYLLLKNQFFYLSDNEHLLLYLFDYMMIMISISMIGQYIFYIVKKVNKK